MATDKTDLETVRLTAHVLLDAASAYSENDEYNVTAFELERLKELNCIRVHTHGTQQIVDVAPLITAVHMLTIGLLEAVEASSGRNREQIIDTMREAVDAAAGQ
jgi:hypothetical protein